MSEFTNTTEEDLWVPLVGRVIPAGESFTVDDEYDHSFAHQPAFGGVEFAPDALEVAEEPPTKSARKKPAKPEQAPSEGDN